MRVMDDVRIPIERTAALIKWNMVGKVLIPGAPEAGTIGKTDGCTQTAAVAVNNVFRVNASLTGLELELLPNRLSVHVFV